MYYKVNNYEPQEVERAVRLLKQRPGKLVMHDQKTLQGGFACTVYQRFDEYRNLLGYEMVVIQPKSDEVNIGWERDFGLDWTS